MKKWILPLLVLMTSSAFANIVSSKGEYFVETKNGKNPIMNVNEMVKNETISKIQTYGEGKVHMISFSKENGPVMLYSVDEKGFIYSIKPYSAYTVSSVDKDGKVSFKEVPKRKFSVDAKGFFLY